MGLLDEATSFATTGMTGGSIKNTVKGSMKNAGPEFSNLGVTDPNTGKPVYLSANEIATVLGATGGVAPTKFQAATEGFFSGVNKGQVAYSNYQAAQSAGLAIDAQEIQNEIAQRTKEATITAKNNQTQQQAIEAQMTTEKLAADNTVLQAIRSGDPEKLTQVVTNPQTMLSAIEQDQYVQGAFNRIKSQNGFTPQQLTAFEGFNRTRDIYKQGPLQDAYQIAAGNAAGTTAFQQLQGMTGLESNALLGGMKLMQVDSGFGPKTALVAPDGKHVLIEDDKEKQALGGFFGAKDKLRSGGLFKLPLGNDFTSPTPPSLQPMPQLPTNNPAPQVAGALPSGTATSTPTPTGEPSYSDRLFGPQNGPAPAPVTPSTQVENANNVAPTGVPLQYTNPQLQGMNTTLTPSGESVTAKTMRMAQEIYAQSGGRIKPEQAVAQATKLALKEVDISAKAKKANAVTGALSQEYRDMATSIRGAVQMAKESGIALGPTWGDSISRTEASIDSMFSENDALGNTLGRFGTLESQYGFIIMKKDGLKAQVVNSNAERELLQAGGPRIVKTEQENLAAADQLDALAVQLEDKASLTSFFNVLKIPDDQALQLANDYQKENPALALNPETNVLTLNPNKKDPITWAQEKLNIKDDATLEAFSTPTQASLSKGSPTAPGSGTSAPFSPAKKENISYFPSTPSKEVRGGDYDATPASLKDIHAIADTTNIKQFQSPGSLPKKLDKATPDLMARLVGAESSGDPNAVSPTGVKGLAQVTKDTFEEVAKDHPEYKLTDRTNPKQSIVAGTLYMNKMLKQFDGNVDFALAAYNAGPGTVESAKRQAGTTNARGTIDEIAPYLPKTQPTDKYVKNITSRGRVAPETEKQKGNGFFDSVITQLNPFAASTAEAEDFTPGLTKEDAAEKIKPGQTLDSKGRAIIGSVSAQNNDPTTDTAVKVAPPAPSARNDIPPVSELDAALKAAQSDAKIDQSMFPAGGRAVKFIRESAVGKFLGEIQQSGIFKGGENFTNAVTFGLYDEGMSALDESMGFDGKIVQDEIRTSLKDFRRNNPKLALATDVIGSIAGGAGAGMMLRALRGVNVARTAATAGETIAPMTVKEGAKIGAAQAGVRGFGEGESLGGRIMGTAAGVTIGGVTGGLAPKVPIAATGGAIGATAAALGGDSSASGMIKGGIEGAIALKFLQKTPLAVKAITKAVTKLNTYLGLKQMGVTFQKLISGKTPAEIAANLSPEDAYVAGITSHWTDQQIKNVITGIRKSNDIGVPSRLFDELNDSEVNSMIKVLRQMSGNKEVQSKIGRFLETRMSGQQGRIASNLGPEDELKMAGEKLVTLANTAKDVAKKKAMGKTEKIYTQAENATPQFKSDKLEQILSTPAMKEALQAGKKEVEATIPTKESSALIDDLSDELMTRAKAGEPIDDILDEFHVDFSQDVGEKEADDIIKALLNPETKELSNNSFKVLQRARIKLRERIDDPDTKGELGLDLKNLYDDLTGEMNKLNPKFEEANLKYQAELAKVDVLRDNKLMAAVVDLKDGNVDLAVQKVLAMPPETLKNFMSVLDNKDTFKTAAEAFIKNKLNTAVKGRDVASRLINDKEFRNLEILLGQGRAKQLRTMIDAESKIARTGKSVIGGSDTAPKLQAAQKIDELTGQTEAPIGAQDIVQATQGGAWNTAARALDKVFSIFRPGVDKEFINELAETLVTSAPKGMKAMENVLKARQLTKAEIKALEPYLSDLLAEGRGARQGVVTSMVGQVKEASNAKRKRK